MKCGVKNGRPDVGWSIVRILVLNYEFPPVGGGGGRAAADICQALAGRGHEIRVQTAHFKGLPRVEARDGYLIYRSPSFRQRAHTCSVWEMGAYLVLNALPALRHVSTWKPHVINAHFAVPTGVLAWFLYRMEGIPYVLSTQLGDIPGGLPEQTDHLFRLIKPFTKRVWADAAAVTAPSEHIREMAGRTYHRPMEVIPNGLDPSSVIHSPPGINDPVRLVFAGRFNPQKNLPLLIDLADRVRDLDWVMDLLGDGPQMPLIRNKIDQIGLTGRIRLHGWVSPQRVTEVLGQSDLMILPSWIEGMPLVGAAALGAGLAILGSAVGGITDVVDQGVNGFLCAPGDIQHFEEALRTLLTDHHLLSAMKKASRQLALRYDLGNVAAEFEKIFLAVGRIED